MQKLGGPELSEEKILCFIEERSHNSSSLIHIFREEKRGEERRREEKRRAEKRREEKRREEEERFADYTYTVRNWNFMAPCGCKILCIFFAKNIFLPFIKNYYCVVW